MPISVKMTTCDTEAESLIVSADNTGFTYDVLALSKHASEMFQISNAKSSEDGFCEILSDKLLLSNVESECVTSSDVAGNGETRIIEKVENSDTSCAVENGFIPPDPKLITDIIAQVEFYFSDVNLPTDKFLLQQICRDKYGFVGLNVLASFRKMKKLVSDLRVIAFALNQSKNLEVSKNGTRVRRMHSLPTDIEKLSRMVVAVNLQEPTLESIKQQFSAFGAVLNISIICRGEFVTGADVRRQVRGGLDSYSKAVTDIALVEYENADGATLACESLTDNSNWRRGLHVSMITVQSSGKKPSSKLKQSDSGEVISSDNALDLSLSTKVKKMQKNSRVGELSQENTLWCKDYSENCLSSPAGQSVSPKSSPSASPKLNCRVDKSAPIQNGTEIESNNVSKGVNPWIQRRIKAHQVNTDGVVGSTAAVEFAASDVMAALRRTIEIVSVIRQPKGPDGSRGFNMAKALI